MRVLHIIPSVALVHGGPSQAISMFEQACRLQGIVIETIATDDDGPGRRKKTTESDNAGNNAPIRRYFRKNFEFYKISFSLAFWLWKNVSRYDIIHIHALFSFTSSVATNIARLKKVPYIIRPLGTLNHYGRQQRRPFVKMLSIIFLEGPAIRHAAAMHFTSSAEQQEAESLGIPMRSHVLPLAVNAIEIKNRQALTDKFPTLLNQPYLLFMSRLDPKKNIEGLLQAFKQVQTSMPNALKCVIAGNGSETYVASLKKCAIDAGIAEHIMWTGHLQAEEKNAAFAGAALFVLPSYSENFGIAAAEALSAGLPCVLSDGVALSAEAEKAGAALVVNTEPLKIAEAILTLMQDASLRKQMSMSAKNFADAQYSVMAMGQGLQKLYDTVIDKSSHRAMQ
jgi:glycosyltransferase involved in cell wall biosynthesis